MAAAIVDSDVRFVWTSHELVSQCCFTPIYIYLLLLSLAKCFPPKNHSLRSSTSALIVKVGKQWSSSTTASFEGIWQQGQLTCRPTVRRWFEARNTTSNVSDQKHYYDQTSEQSIGWWYKTKLRLERQFRWDPIARCPSDHDSTRIGLKYFIYWFWETRINPPDFKPIKW